jgi:tetratricopeptide (TPR) repeat protein
MEERENAMQEYQKSVKIDPEFYNSWYNIGAMNYNAAVELYDEANTKTDVDEYNKAKEVADAALMQAIPPMLKAAEFCPEGDTAPFQTLKTIYYRLGDTEKYEEMNKILEEMK